ncbi:MAG TPA: helix-turn-helix domain-containing protein [Chloroflexi bacterium]|nr:helix-turn-helix domain-containing protein [Chloroflexota bacterium]
MSEFLTTRQLQDILRVDRTTIYRMADDGRIPAVKVGSQWRFPRQSIEGWLKTQSPVGATVQDASSPNESDLSKLIPIECVQRIQDAFADILGVMLVVTDLNGRPVTAPSHVCRLYALAQRSPTAQQQCRQEWAALARQPDLQPTFSRSYLGLLHTRGLVRVGSELRAMVVVSGIAPTHWPPADTEIARLTEYLDASETEVRQAMTQAFTLNDDQRRQVLAYVQRIADIVAHIMNERNILFTKLHNIAELTRI